MCQPMLGTNIHLAVGFFRGPYLLWHYYYEDPWHSHLLPSVSSGAVTTCFYDLGLSQLEFEHPAFHMPKVIHVNWNCKTKWNNRNNCTFSIWYFVAFSLYSFMSLSNWIIWVFIAFRICEKNIQSSIHISVKTVLFSFDIARIWDQFWRSKWCYEKCL